MLTASGGLTKQRNRAATRPWGLIFILFRSRDHFRQGTTYNVLVLIGVGKRREVRNLFRLANDTSAITDAV